MQTEISSQKGDTRYYNALGDTVLAATTTAGIPSSATTANGALYHGAEVMGTAFITTTARIVFQLQGTLEIAVPSAGTAWYSIGTPMTLAAATSVTATPIVGTFTTIQAQYVRMLATPNTQPCTVNAVFRGDK